MKKVVTIILILAVLAGGGFFVYHKVIKKSNNPRQASSRQERFYEVQKGSITKTISTNGQVQPVKERDLNFSGNGIIKQVLMKQGQRVKRGDLLAAIENTQQELNMIKAKNSYELALISSSKAEQKEKELEFKLAEKSYQDTFLRAPFDGLITVVGIEAADSLSNGTNAKVAGHIIDDSQYLLQLSIDEVDIAQIQVGQLVHISLEAYPKKRFEGKVSKIGLVAQMESGIRTIPVEVIMAKQDENILTGVSATADIVIGEARDVLVIPVTASIQRRDTAIAMKKGADGKVNPVEIKVGISNNIMTEVIEGLNEGDQIVINNSSAIQGIRNQSQGNRGMNMNFGNFGAQNNRGGNR